MADKIGPDMGPPQANAKPITNAPPSALAWPFITLCSRGRPYTVLDLEMPGQVQSKEDDYDVSPATTLQLC